MQEEINQETLPESTGIAPEKILRWLNPERSMKDRYLVGIPLRDIEESIWINLTPMQQKQIDDTLLPNEQGEQVHMYLKNDPNVPLGGHE